MRVLDATCAHLEPTAPAGRGWFRTSSREVVAKTGRIGAKSRERRRDGTIVSGYDADVI
jgi:hypothetical protein